MIGVEDFYMYNNNSTDNYAKILKFYIKNVLVTFIDFPYDQAQVKAYQYFYETYRPKYNNLNEWIMSYEKYPVIQIYWKMFAASGLMKHDYNKFVIEKYYANWNKIYDCGKCLINNDYTVAAYDATTHHEATIQINHYWSKAWDVYDAKRKHTNVYFKKKTKVEIEYYLFHESKNCVST